MSADPVTLAIASFAVQAFGTMQQVKAQKAETKETVKEYEEEKKYNVLKGIQDSNDVLEEANKKRKINRAIQAGLGYSDTSRSFLSTQSEIDRIAQKDITNIRINTRRGGEKLQSQIYSTKVMGKAKTYGGYSSIVSPGFKTAAYATSYKSNPQGGQYDLSNTNKMDDD